MAYSINGKVYTDHPLMDEMVFNLNNIMNNIVLKNEERALNNETERSLNESSTYMSILQDHITYETFPFTKDILTAYGYTPLQVTNYLGDRYRVPEIERVQLLDFACEYYIQNYEETNNYYRMLMGLPDYNSGEQYFVYLDETYFTDPEYVTLMDFSLPIHQYSQYQISLLDLSGVMDRVIDEHIGINYAYLRFLGDRSIDLFTARQAAKWDILYIPSVEHLVESRFKQIFAVNRTSYLQRVYSFAQKQGSDYYDEFLMIMLICQTYTDMIVDIPEWYIRRDVFDLRSCQYFIESNGVEFFKTIPLKYQINIVRGLNKLIRYKSTNKNIDDIIDIFDVDNVQVFKYYLYKKRIKTDKGYSNTGDPTQDYELEFIKTPIGDTYDNTIKDNIYRRPYDDITYEDKYWDGEDSHDYVKLRHLEKDFTIEGTKYISLDMNVSMTDYQFQLTYFLGLLMDSNLDSSDIKISLPTISSRVSFNLSDLFILLFCFTGIFEGYGNDIKLPSEAPSDPKPTFESYPVFDGGGPSTTEFDDNVFGGWSNTLRKFRRPVNGGGPEVEYTEVTQESFYEWMRWKYDYLWTDLSDKVFGFNMRADMNDLADMIDERHSSFGFSRGYTLEELGVDKFIYASEVRNVEELMEIYRVNKEVHDELVLKMTQAETRDDYIIYQFVYDYLFTRDFDIDRYVLSNGEVALNYEDILKDHNIILWRYFNKVISEPDLETKQDMVRQAMNDIVNTLSYYINDPSLKDIFAFSTVASHNSILRYIYMMIDFFKSFKVYFLDPYVTYVLDNKLENQVNMRDMLTEVKEAYWRKDKVSNSDTVNITEEITLEDKYTQDNNIEVLDILEQYEPIPGFDIDINGFFPNSTDDETSRDFDGGGVDLLSYSPYIMLNGGIVGKGLHLHDLDGGGPVEMAYYLNVDGMSAGISSDPNDFRRVGFSVDGGHPDNHMWITRSLNVRVIDNQIVADIKLYKTYRNKLEIDDTGLLLRSDNYVDYDEYAALVDDVDATVARYSQEFNDALENISIASSPEFVDALITNAIDEYFVEARSVIDRMYGDQPLIDAKAYTDQKNQELLDIFNNFSLLSWGEF